MTTFNPGCSDIHHVCVKINRHLCVHRLYYLISTCVRNIDILIKASLTTQHRLKHQFLRNDTKKKVFYELQRNSLSAHLQYSEIPWHNFSEWSTEQNLQLIWINGIMKLKSSLAWPHRDDNSFRQLFPKFYYASQKWAKYSELSTSFTRG